MPEKPNRWERHQNNRARGKKERAKARHFAAEETDEGGEWESVEQVDDSARTGIIAETRVQSFTVMENDALFECRLAASVQAGLSQNLVVGDRVKFIATSGEEGEILTREDRRTVLARMRGDSERISAGALERHVIAANVDRAVIVAAARDPEFHPRFVDRYLVVAQDGGIEPVVCINKSDLVTGEHPAIQTYRQLGISILQTSVPEGRGLMELRESIRGKIAVLVGNSGVGKSSLANALIPGSDLHVGEVSHRGGRGRHTTTSTSLHKWDDESYIIDTPGIRSLGIEGIPKSELRHYFPEFEKPSAGCKFRDCVHDQEPVCGVKQAVDSGDISRLRYESYLRMVRE
jgi:ribosome biogenesis GTPase